MPSPVTAEQMITGYPILAYTPANGTSDAGSTRSALFRHTTGRMPDDSALTSRRSMSAGFGAGSAALATMST